MKHLAAALLFALCACTDPHDTVLPASGDFKAVAKQANQLNDEEMTLLAAYMVRMTTKPNTGIPQGVTIRAAIDYQRAFNKAESTRR